MGVQVPPKSNVNQSEEPAAVQLADVERKQAPALVQQRP